MLLVTSNSNCIKADDIIYEKDRILGFPSEIQCWMFLYGIELGIRFWFLMWSEPSVLPLNRCEVTIGRNKYRSRWEIEVVCNTRDWSWCGRLWKTKQISGGETSEDYNPQSRKLLCMEDVVWRNYWWTRSYGLPHRRCWSNWSGCEEAGSYDSGMDVFVCFDRRVDRNIRMLVVIRSVGRTEGGICFQFKIVNIKSTIATAILEERSNVRNSISL